VHDKNEQAFSCLKRTKAKGKVHPTTSHEGSDRELMYIFTHSLTSALDRGGGGG